MAVACFVLIVLFSLLFSMEIKRKGCIPEAFYSLRQAILTFHMLFCLSKLPY